MNINIIIFSFNRAMQLSALLRSISSFWQKQEHKISIIYNTTSSDFELGYEKLRQQYPSCTFLKESMERSATFFPLLRPYNFLRWLKYGYLRRARTNFRSLLLSVLRESSTSRGTMFLTDDSVFIRSVELKNKILNKIITQQFSFQYSLRLGLHQDSPPEHLISEDGLLSWNYMHPSVSGSWAYPFSVDGHIYATSALKIILSRLIYCNPNSLEGFVSAYCRKKRLFSRSFAPKQTHMLSYPLNVVQSVVNNESLGISYKMLNDNFLQGYELELPIPEDVFTFQQYPGAIYLVRQKDRITINTSL